MQNSIEPNVWTHRKSAAAHRGQPSETVRRIRMMPRGPWDGSPRQPFKTAPGVEPIGMNCSTSLNGRFVGRSWRERPVMGALRAF